MKIWHISDTHTYHHLLTIPTGIDIVIHSGDCSNPLSPYTNEPEVRKFIEWYKSLEIPHKIFVAGNHDSSIARGLISRNNFTENGITYLQDEEITIDGLKLYGTPWSPRYGNWEFMKKRETMNRVWEAVPTDVDILITHTPPKGVLDLSYTPSNEVERCGCGALMKWITKHQPQYNLFGHIHNTEDIINAGVLEYSSIGTIFSNGSVVTDGKFGRLSSNGNTFEIG